MPNICGRDIVGRRKQIPVDSLQNVTTAASFIYLIGIALTVLG